VEGVLKPREPRRVLRCGAARQHRATAAVSDTPGGSGRSSHNGTQGPCGRTPTRTASDRSVSWGLLLDSMFRIVTAVEQFMTEFNGTVSEEEETVAITKNCLKSHEH
jgi:hypothetical protein